VPTTGHTLLRELLRTRANFARCRGDETDPATRAAWAATVVAHQALADCLWTQAEEAEGFGYIAKIGANSQLNIYRINAPEPEWRARRLR
jgi:hypothetical protein